MSGPAAPIGLLYETAGLPTFDLPDELQRGYGGPFGLDEPRVFLRIGQENERDELKSLSIVASGYGHSARSLGAVSVIGPVRMDYGQAIASVRAAAAELSRFVGELYE